MSQPKAVAIPPGIREFLEKHTRAFLFTLRKDGSPTGHPMLALGSLTFNTYRKSAKARNLERDERVGWLVTTGKNDSAFLAVLVRGRAGIAEGEGARRGRRSPDPTVTEELGARSQESMQAGKRAVFEIIPEQVGFLAELREG